MPAQSKPVMDKAPAPAKVKKGQKHKKPPVATADQDDESEEEMTFPKYRSEMSDETKLKQDDDNILHAEAKAYLEKHRLGYGYVSNQEPRETQVINKRAINDEMATELLLRVREEPDRENHRVVLFARRETVANLKEKKDDLVLDAAKSCVLKFTTPPILVAGNHRFKVNNILAGETQKSLEEYEARMANDPKPEEEKLRRQAFLTANRNQAQCWPAEIYDLDAFPFPERETNGTLIWKACDILSANKEIFSFSGSIQEKVGRYCRANVLHPDQTAEVMRSYITTHLDSNSKKDRTLDNILVKILGNPTSRIFVNTAAHLEFCSPFFEKSYLQKRWLDQPGNALVYPILLASVMVRQALVTTPLLKHPEAGLLQHRDLIPVFDDAFDAGLAEIGNMFLSKKWVLFVGSPAFKSYCRAVATKLAEGHRKDGKQTEYDEVVCRVCLVVEQVFKEFRGPNGEFIPGFSPKLLGCLDALVEKLGNTAFLLELSFDPQYYLRGSKTGAHLKRRNIEPAAGYMRVLERSSFDLSLNLGASQFADYWRLGGGLVKFVVEHAAPLNDFIGFHFRSIFAKVTENRFLDPPKATSEPPPLPPLVRADRDLFLALYAAEVHTPEDGEPKRSFDLKKIKKETHPITHLFKKIYIVKDDEYKYLIAQLREVTKLGRNKHSVEWIFQHLHDFVNVVLPVIWHCSTDVRFRLFLEEARWVRPFHKDPSDPKAFMLPNLITMDEIDPLVPKKNSQGFRSLSPMPVDEVEPAKKRKGKGKSKAVRDATPAPESLVKEQGVGLALVRDMVDDFKGVFIAHRHIYKPEGARDSAETLTAAMQMLVDAWTNENFEAHAPPTDARPDFTFDPSLFDLPQDLGSWKRFSSGAPLPLKNNATPKSRPTIDDSSDEALNDEAGGRASGMAVDGGEDEADDGSGGPEETGEDEGDDHTTSLLRSAGLKPAGSGSDSSLSNPSSDEGEDDEDEDEDDEDDEDEDDDEETSIRQLRSRGVQQQSSRVDFSQWSGKAVKLTDAVASGSHGALRPAAHKRSKSKTTEDESPPAAAVKSKRRKFT